MRMNLIADGHEPLDLSQSDELASLCESAHDLGIAHPPPESGHNVHGQNTPGFIAEVSPFVDSLHAPAT